MAGPDPAIHPRPAERSDRTLNRSTRVDGRVKPGHDGGRRGGDDGARDGRRRCRCSLVLAALLTLSACSLSDSVAGNSIDYDRALEDVGNAMVVSNILRARDGAPLHFTDLSQIRGSLQLQMQGQLSAPIGPQYVSSTRTRAGLLSTVTTSTNPSFDVVPLNTKQFTEGITTPVELKTLQYYADEVGDSDRAGRPFFSLMLIRLFIEKIDLISDRDGNRIVCEFYNHPNGDLRAAEFSNTPSSDCDRRALATFALDRNHMRISSSGTVNFNDIVPQLARRLVLVAYHAPFGPPIHVSDREFLDQAGRLAADGLNLRAVPNRPGLFQLYKAAAQTVLCLEPQADARHKVWHVVQQARPGEPVASLSSQSAQRICAPDAAASPAAAGKPESLPQVVIYLRSAESVIAYLGQMLNVPDRKRALPFFIRDTDAGHARFRVLYRGAYYYVDDNDGRRNQTLQILSIVNMTLNLYKNASEIPTTRAVQSVP